MHSSRAWLAAFALLAVCAAPAPAPAANRLSIDWTNRMLTVTGGTLPAPLQIWYLEAYCRPASTDREWDKTVIPHRTELLSREPDGRRIRLRDILEDGMLVEHTLTAGGDEVDFRVVATNPGKARSDAHWVQPCMRVDAFTGTTRTDAREVVPAYVRKSFIFVDGRLTRMPTEPWATKARYIPGQVWAAPGVDRNDVNPRPLSVIIPSNGLIGCFSADDRQILAMAWDSWQELFQGVIACLHSDFRLGGLAPGETKKVHGKIYVLPADENALVRRYGRDLGAR